MKYRAQELGVKCHATKNWCEMSHDLCILLLSFRVGNLNTYASLIPTSVPEYSSPFNNFGIKFTFELYVIKDHVAMIYSHNTFHHQLGTGWGIIGESPGDAK